MSVTRVTEQMLGCLVLGILYSPGQPRIQYPLASIAQVLGLQVCAMTLSFGKLFFFFKIYYEG